MIIKLIYLHSINKLYMYHTFTLLVHFYLILSSHITGHLIICLGSLYFRKQLVRCAHVTMHMVQIRGFDFFCLIITNMYLQPILKTALSH